MQESMMPFINISPLFIAIVIGFAVSFNENISIRVPAIIVATATIISRVTAKLDSQFLVDDPAD